ncbi:MAG: hypothetical protein Q4C22_01925 [Bacillota bacterium]|nr:hypothetical protein [Bacillota bacterium]
MNDLTVREKKLLYLLAVVIIVAGGIALLLMPLMEKYQLTQDELYAQQLQEQEFRALLETRDAMEEELSALSEQTEEDRDLLYPYMTAEQVDYLLTSMLISHSLTPRSLALGDETVLATPPYGSIIEEETGETDESAAVAEYGGLLGRVASISATGSMESLISLADAMAENPSLQLENVSAAVNRSGGGYSITLEVSVYMNEEQ